MSEDNRNYDGLHELCQEDAEALGRASPVLKAFLASMRMDVEEYYDASCLMPKYVSPAQGGETGS